MTHYALIFYATRSLTTDELQQRHIQIVKWVKETRSMGIDLDPRAFDTPLARLSPSGIERGIGGVEDRFGNIVFFDAASHDQAMEVAKAHPGVHFETVIEVREWKSPAAG